jgi:hypothetical protein
MRFCRKKLASLGSGGSSGSGGRPTGNGRVSKTEEEKADVVIEYAGEASSIIHHAVATSANTFHWNTDTGATSHMTPHKNWIRNYTPYRVPIRLADNSVVYSEGVGSVVFILLFRERLLVI